MSDELKQQEKNFDIIQLKAPNTILHLPMALKFKTLIENGQVFLHIDSFKLVYIWNCPLLSISYCWSNLSGAEMETILPEVT